MSSLNSSNTRDWDKQAVDVCMKLSGVWAMLLLLVVVCAGDTASAAEPLPVEKLITLPRIPSTGPLLYSTDGQRVLLTDAGTLKWQATLGFPGWRGQYVLPKTNDLAYLTTSVWGYGEGKLQGKRTSFVEIWNVPTASPTGVRIEVPPRLAITGPIQAMGEFGWWQACDDLGEPGYPITGKGSSNFNALTSMAELDPVSGAPRFRSLACEIKRVPIPYARWTGFAPLKVVGVRAEPGNITIVELARSDGALLPPYQPGQFISFGTQSLSGTRSYSLVGAAQERTDRYTIAVKREPRGVVSRAVANLRAGDAVKATMVPALVRSPL